MRERFDQIIDPKWIVSVIRKDGTRIPLFNLIDDQVEVMIGEADGFEREWVYPSYASNPARFTAKINDEWELFAFIWILAHA